MQTRDATEPTPTADTSAGDDALYYTGLTLYAAAIGPAAAARRALAMPGRAGLIAFAAARGDSAREIAAALGIDVAAVDRIARGNLAGD